MAIGAQKDFNWTQVGLAALGGAVSGGMMNSTPLGPMGGAAVEAPQVIARAAISSALNQGIAVATGLQKDFSWSNVAFAAVGAGLSHAMNGALGLNAPSGGPSGFDRFALSTMSGFASGMTMNALRGGQMTAAQVATDAFGNALGNSIAGQLGRSSEQEQKSQQSRSYTNAVFNQLVDAFSNTTEPSTANGVLYAANGVKDPLAPVVVSDAGGGGDVGADVSLDGNPATAIGKEEAQALMRIQMQNGKLSTQSAEQLKVYNENYKKSLDAWGDNYVTDSFGNVRFFGKGEFDAVDVHGGTAKDVSSFNQVIVGSDGVSRGIPEMVQNLRDGNGDNADRAFGSAVLRDRFGYAMGTLNGTPTEMKGGLLTDWTPRNSASGISYGPAAAADRFLAAPQSIENQERLQLFGNGSVTRVDEDGRESRIRIGWSDDYANRAKKDGIDPLEARAKTSWDTYRGVLDAAFATSGINSIQINGAWRPPSYGGPHVKGRGLDVLYVNGTKINNESGTVAQPDLVRDLSYNLRWAGAGQVIQPWMTYNTAPKSTGRVELDNGFRSNSRVLDVEKEHLNHLHVTWPR
jgi:hypothetical protein